MKHIEEHEEEEGEAWLMSYADLISLLLAVFVLLFSLSSIDPPRAEIAAKAISTYLRDKTTDGIAAGDISLVDKQLMALRLLTQFLDLGNIDNVLEKMMKLQEQPEELKRLQALAERLGLFGNARLRSNVARYEIIIPEQLLFEKGTVFLTKEGASVFKKITPRVIDALADPKRSLEIIGHSDGTPLDKNSPYSSSQIQSAAQAEAVSLALQTYGVSAQRISIIGKGSTEPLFSEVDARGQRNINAENKNRRVVISIVNDAREATP